MSRPLAASNRACQRPAYRTCSCRISACSCTGALAIAVLGYAESASVAQGFATRHRYDIDANRELIAIGGSNIL